MGFYYSLLKPVFFFIVPGGQEAKYSGVFTFCQAILNWAPLLAFSLAYSLTDALVGGFIIMAAFQAAGCACLASVDMEQARAMVVSSGTLGLRADATAAADDDDAPANLAAAGGKRASCSIDRQPGAPGRLEKV